MWTELQINIHKHWRRKMKQRLATSVALLVLVCCYSLAFGQKNVTVVASTPELSQGLDLKALCELFKQSENLEDFEKALNDPKVGINNLDLDGDGEVDYIRVVEEVADNTHVIILQVPTGENEFQDVATIEVEKTGEDAYNMQVHGDDVIYGPNYYIVPPPIQVHSWPLITWIYRPAYQPYVSGFHFGFYPQWWVRYHPIKVNMYHRRAIRFTKGTRFTITRVSRVTTVHKVNYKPHSSVRIRTKTKTVRTHEGVKKTTRTTVRKGRR
jgi:hypothetical protein